MNKKLEQILTISNQLEMLITNIKKHIKQENDLTMNKSSSKANELLQKVIGKTYNLQTRLSMLEKQLQTAGDSSNNTSSPTSNLQTQLEEVLRKRDTSNLDTPSFKSKNQSETSLDGLPIPCGSEKILKLKEQLVKALQKRKEKINSDSENLESKKSDTKDTDTTPLPCGSKTLIKWKKQVRNAISQREKEVNNTL